VKIGKLLKKPDSAKLGFLFDYKNMIYIK
jgi:hypothetical protein